MIHFEICRKDNSILFTNMPQCSIETCFLREENDCNLKINARNLFQRTASGSVRVVVVGDGEHKKYVVSSREAKKLLAVFVDAHDMFVEFEKKNHTQIQETVGLFFHNLVQVHTHLKDKVERLFSGDVQRAIDYKEQKEQVKKAIEKDIDKAADDICQIAKRLDDLDAQLTGFTLMSGVFRAISVNIINANLKKVFLRNAQPFLDELKQNGVELSFDGDDEYYEKNRAKIDPKLINAALHHFFQNITKYVHPYSIVHISLEVRDEKIEIIISMTSVRIEKHELQSIFIRGKSGENVGSLAGQGIGMAVIKKALEHFGANIRIEPDYSKTENFQDKQYVLNKFIFEFPRALIKK